MGEDGADVIVMKGSYSYTSPDGQLITVNWIADENGFQAIGDHLPKPVEIPFPEQRVAVEAQLKFAAEEDARVRQGKSLRPEVPVQRRKPVQVAPQAQADHQADYSEDY